MTNSLHDLAERVAESLERTGRQLVLAESCTAGLVAAALGTVPGISRHLCGSAVVYQERTKVAWLGVPERLFENPGVVSAPVAEAMTDGALTRTPYADIAAAVTGHLGPDAPSNLDGLIYASVQARGSNAKVVSRRLAAANGASPAAIRRERQIAAAETVLSELAAALEAVP